MPRRAIARLLIGFRQFREKFFSADDSVYGKLSTVGQAPKTLIIGCGDSRADPAILFSSKPGELFVVRNIANLVPPFEQGPGLHGVSSAIEYAVVNLKVEVVMVLGHRQCGGIRALLYPDETGAGSFVRNWMKMAEPAKLRAIQSVGTGDPDTLCRRCELESIRTSIENLRTFPFVAEAIRERKLALLGVFFDLEKGEMLELNEETGEFSPVVV